ncbi:hypothetical protein ACR79M_18460 [Sphingobacterium spiritivorum]|uniref:hypothetical protein n=1 Tax=Sphingobacterium spiritivorum TaxID=258 RepID=UPI003DA4E628
MSQKKNKGINAYLLVALLLVVIVWLMVGISKDDEFNEYRVFLKYRPTVQLYFESPLGMDDMPPDFPEKLKIKKAIYDDFVLTKHWSDQDIYTITAEFILLFTLILLFIGVRKQLKK